MDRGARRSLLDGFPFLAEAGEDLRDELGRAAETVRLAAGSLLFRAGEGCASVVLIAGGRVRIYRSAPSGREITLHRLRPGEVCIYNVASVVARVPYPAHAAAETPVTALAVPAAAFLAWIDRAPALRSLVFQRMAAAFVSLPTRIERAAWARLDRRLAGLLLSRVGTPGDVVELTHGALAGEVGSTREATSRLLGEFQRRGWVRLRRARIQVLDPAALAGLARGHPPVA